MDKKSLWFFGGIVGIIIIFCILFILVGVGVMYNSLVKRDVAVESAWAQVETVLQRRADLIPSLVSSVKGYMKHEREILDGLFKARTQYTGAKSLDEKIKAAREMDTVLGRLLVIVENYPHLKANETYIRLMDELAGTENRIAVERMRYNRSVQDLNTIIRKVPYNLVAKRFKFKMKPFYETEPAKKEVPKVEF